MRQIRIPVSMSVSSLGSTGGTHFTPIINAPEVRDNNATRPHELYTLADPCCASRVSVPVLWDKVERTIVSNEASEIMRMFNAAFDALGHCRATTIRSRRGKKSVQPTRVYESLNNGVYRTGFAARRDALTRRLSRKSSIRWTGLRHGCETGNIWSATR